MNDNQMIVNFNSLKDDTRDKKFDVIKVSAPLISNYQTELCAADYRHNLENSIVKLSNKFPHRRIALTYSIENKTLYIEIHPVTGAA